jgi:hypothetical protein
VNESAALSEQKRELQDQINRWSIWANRGSKAWSFVYHFSFGAAAVVGVIVAVLSGGKLGGENRDLLICILSAVAAILTTIGGFGGFERKWRTNRRTRADLELLKIDLSDPKSDVAQMRANLKTIIGAHEAGIMSGDQPLKSP